MRTLLIIGAMLLSGLASAGMRCGTSLIDRGDSVIHMIALCGQPQQSGLNIIYLNKDGDGMNYYIHSQSNGIIDSIKSSRGGLR